MADKEGERDLSTVEAEIVEKLRYSADEGNADPFVRYRQRAAKEEMLRTIKMLAGRKDKRDLSAVEAEIVNKLQNSADGGNACPFVRYRQRAAKEKMIKTIRVLARLCP